MVNFDGNCYQKFPDIPDQFLNYFLQLPIHTHHFLTYNGKIIMLEESYFSIMASLRRSRVRIPMKYTLEYFQEQSETIIHDIKIVDGYSLILIKFYRKENPTKESPVCDICFLMESLRLEWKSESIFLTLYKDHHILAESFSNLFQSNELLRKLAKVFAYENNFGACLLINNEKKIAESTHGSVFLIFGNKVLTPPLSSGVVDDFSRKIMIKFINQNNSYQIVEEEISVYNLQRADEIFLFSFIYGFIKISQFRKKKFSTDVSKNIQDLFFSKLKNQF